MTPDTLPTAAPSDGRLVIDVATDPFAVVVLRALATACRRDDPDRAAWCDRQIAARVTPAGRVEGGRQG